MQLETNDNVHIWEVMMVKRKLTDFWALARSWANLAAADSSRGLRFSLGRPLGSSDAIFALQKNLPQRSAARFTLHAGKNPGVHWFWSELSTTFQSWAPAASLTTKFHSVQVPLDQLLSCFVYTLGI